MSTKTQNYNLIKPALTDAADITATNSNWDKIDSELKQRYSPQNKPTATDVGAMSNTNPSATGTFSLNRKAGTTVGEYSVAEGYDTTATGAGSHAEGYDSTASGDMSHAEGAATVSSGKWSHSEGSNATASNHCSHAEGAYTTASGEYSHAVGYYSTAGSNYSHAEGYSTTASSVSQHVQGKYNIEDTSGTYAHIVGNGSSSKRSNAHTLDWSGNAWFAGDVYVGGTDKSSGSKLVKQSELPQGTSIDTTLSVAGQAADAKATGDAIKNINVPVTKVNNKTGAVTLSAADVGAANTTLSNVANANFKSKATSAGIALSDMSNVSMENLKIAGKLVAGETFKYPNANQNKTAGDGAEIFNDYRSRTYDTSGNVTAGNVAVGNYSHAEGYQTTAVGNRSHAEGYDTTAYGINSHAEGDDTYAHGTSSHAEGLSTNTSGNYSHAEGSNTLAANEASHCEGSKTTTLGKYSHAEGLSSTVLPDDIIESTDNNDCITAWASSEFSLAKGTASHVEG